MWYRYSYQKPDEDAGADCKSSLAVVLIFEEARVLKGSVCWRFGSV